MESFIHKFVVKDCIQLHVTELTAEGLHVTELISVQLNAHVTELNAEGLHATEAEGLH